MSEKIKKKEKAKILFEQTERRGKNTKYFVTENHGGVAAIYPYPVHYQEDGQWKEIDNSLQEENTEEEGYENKNAHIKVKFAKHGNSKKLVTLRNGKHKLSWGLERVKENKLEKTDFEIYEKVEENSNDETIATWNNSKMMTANVESGGVYKNILDNIDLEYQIIGESLKENIILKTPESANTEITFRLRHNGLILSEDEEKRLCFTDEKSEGDIIFCLAVPHMYDQSGIYSDAISYQTVSDKKDETLLTIVADDKWLNDSGRQYPVVIDPGIETMKETKNIIDTFVREAYPNSSIVGSYGSFVVGNTKDYRRCRSFVKIKDLPVLPEGAVIYDAVLNICQYNFSAGTVNSFYVEAHEVTGSWTDGSATWNNQPAISATVLDYAEVKSVIASGGKYAVPKQFHITKPMKNWYADKERAEGEKQNWGICFKMYNEGSVASASFVSSNHPTGGDTNITTAMYPSCMIYYRDASGLEDYYSYHEQSVGRAGTCYVNNYNGNMVLIHPDASTSGNVFPVSLSHVYNAAEHNTDGGLGYGWRLSAWKKLESTDNSNYPYRYTDEDGTKHYFYKDNADNNKLKDEDGLGLVITQTSSDDDNSYMIMETKDKVKMIFRKDGWISREISPHGYSDTNPLTITYIYETIQSKLCLTKIKDPTGSVIQLYYSTTGRLTSIMDEAGRSIRFAYENNDLKTITYPDNKVTRYGYGVGDEQHLLMYVKAPDEYEVDYIYKNDCGVKRVTHIAERKGSQIGREIKISYPGSNKTIFRESGLDGILENTGDDITAEKGDDRIYIYQFDDSGRPVCIYDQDGNAVSYSYFEEGQKRHKLSVTGSTMKPIQNYLKNTRFEDKLNNWSISTPGDSQITVVAGNGYIGDKSAMIERNTIGYNESELFQDVNVGTRSPLKAGKTYTFSAYVKLKDLDQADVRLEVTQVQSTGTLHMLKYSDRLSENTDDKINRGWRRISVTFTIPSDTAKIRVKCILSHGTGKCMMTCAQLEEGSVANKFNLLENGAFEYGDSSNEYLPEGFTEISTDVRAYADGRNYDTHKSGDSSLRIYGEPGKRKGFWKRIPIYSSENDVFSISGWAKGVGVPGREFGITVGFDYGAGNIKWESIPFNPHESDWQFVSKTVSPNDQIADTSNMYCAILFHVFYGYNANDAYFDNLQIIRDDGESYVYDDNGNLISAKSAADRSGFAYEGNNNLSKLTELTGISYEYGYDNRQNLKRAVSSEQIVYQFEYDEKGNPIRSLAYGEPRHGSVTSGRTYYIREKVSGKYLEVPGSSTTAGTAVKLSSWQGKSNQKWKAVDVGAGYFILQPAHTSGMALDVSGGKDQDNTTVDIAVRNNTADAQKFKLIPLDEGAYHIAAKCSKDKRVLTNASASYGEGTAVTIWYGDSIHNHQRWYFEPADQDVTDNPLEDCIFTICASHSRQCLDVKGGGTAEGTVLQQSYYNGEDSQCFYLQRADSSNYYIRPLCAMDMALARISYDSSIQRPAIVLKPFGGENVNISAQQFQFRKVGNYYAIWNSASEEGMGIKDNSYTSGSRVVTHGGALSTYAPNKLFILKNRGKRIQSSLTYTGDGKQVKSITDSRGITAVNTYTSKNRLLSSITDAKKTVTKYTYDTNNDHLQKVEVSNPNETQKISSTYTYDTADRVTSIGHNGFSYNYEYDVFGNPTKVKVGNTTLESYTYLPHNGLKKTTTYANGYIITNEYDEQFRLISRKKKKVNGAESTLFENTYDAYDNIITRKDWEGGATYQYEYDLINRLIAMNSNYGQNIRISYDEKNRVESIQQNAENESICTTYHYGNGSASSYPGLLYGLSIDDKEKVRYTYDNLGRITKREILLDNGKTYSTEFTYVPGKEPGTTTTLVASMKNGDCTLYYEYDEAGNIKSISEKASSSASKEFKAAYTYDAFGRLIRENSKTEDKTICYTYDEGGNILKREAYSFTTASTPTGTHITSQYDYFDDEWKDKLSGYKGMECTYDAMGNMTKERGLEMTWQNGKELQSVDKGNTSILYYYNSDGIRVGKYILSEDNQVTTTNFYLNGNKILTQAKGNEITHFIYDQYGKPFAMKTDGKIFYYLYNCQGDVIGMLDTNGSQIAEYEYDSWGKLLVINDYTHDGYGHRNPFRYKGYYYDDETGFYYLNSRYYDPELRRFLSADDIGVLKLGNISNYNLYAYCQNNPVNYEDSKGRFAWVPILVTIGVCGAIGAVLGGIEASANGDNVLKGIILGGITSAATAAVGAFGAPTIACVTAGAAIYAGADYVSQRIDAEIEDKPFEWNESQTIREATLGGVFGAIPNLNAGSLEKGIYQGYIGLLTGSVAMPIRVCIPAEQVTSSQKDQGKNKDKSKKNKPVLNGSGRQRREGYSWMYW